MGRLSDECGQTVCVMTVKLMKTLRRKTQARVAWSFTTEDTECTKKLEVTPVARSV
jgi:hypothetical protein